MIHLTRLQCLTRSYISVLATCPACGANGHGRLTAAGRGILLLAVALQFGVAVVVKQQRWQPRYRDALARARVHIPIKAALVVGHLVRVQVSGFIKPGSLTHSQRRQHYVAVTPMQTAGGDSAGDALRGLRREVGVEGFILDGQGCTIPSDLKRVDHRRRGCECSDRGGAVASDSGSIERTEPTTWPPSRLLNTR